MSDLRKNYKTACGYFVNVKELIGVLNDLPYSHVACEKLYDIIEELVEEVEIQIDDGDGLLHNYQEKDDPLGLFGAADILKFPRDDSEEYD